MLLIYYYLDVFMVVIQDKEKAPREKILLKKTKVYYFGGVLVLVFVL